MRYLADTDWVIDYLNGQPNAIAYLESLRPRGLAISLMSYGEIYDGIYGGPNPTAFEQGFHKFLRRAPILQLDEAIMRRFARIRGQLRRQGQRIADPDLLIAATAMEYQLTLVTRNFTHFSRIADLQIHSPN